MSEFYLVKKGDNLTKIARQNNTTVKELLKLNPGLKKGGNLIFAGDKINLPAGNIEDINMNVQGFTVERNPLTHEELQQKYLEQVEAQIAAQKQTPAPTQTQTQTPTQVQTVQTQASTQTQTEAQSEVQDYKNVEKQVFETCGLTLKELSDKNIIAELKHGKIVYTDVSKGAELSEEQIKNLRPDQGQVNEPDDKPQNEIADIASKYLNYGKYDGSYKLFTHGRSESRWCAYFVSHVAREYGKEDFNYSSVSQILKWGKDNDTFHKDAQVGDIIIFKGRNSKGRRVSHTGIVTSVENGRVKTIEGNASGRVAQREYSLNDSKITGYVSLA